MRVIKTNNTKPPPPHTTTWTNKDPVNYPNSSISIKGNPKRGAASVCSTCG